MKLLYLYVEDFRGLKNVEFNLDSNERFHYDGHSLKYLRSSVIKEGFFSIGGACRSVESVSAIVGENGSGKTSFATLLNYIFVLGRPYPKCICICKIEGNYIAFDNLTNTPDDSQVVEALGKKWDYRSKNLHRDTEGCPFEVLYYSPFLHPSFIWNDRNKWCHDISATGCLNASVGKIMSRYFGGTTKDADQRSNVPDSPIECLGQDLNIARIEFLHNFAALTDAVREGVPFPMSLSMDIKPNLELFVEFEGYLHQLSSVEKDNLEMQKNIKDMARLKNHYQTNDPFKLLLIAFTICLAQELGYERLGHDNCPEVHDLINMCCRGLDVEDVVRALETGSWDAEQRCDFDPKSWIYVDSTLLCEFVKLWKRLYDNRQENTMGGGFRVSLQNAEPKKELMRLLCLQARLLSVRRGLEVYNPSRRKRFLACDPTGMSSGECSYLNFFALLYQKINSELSRIDGPLLIAIDEAETTLHPGWQRQMVYNVIWFLENFVSSCSTHVIFMTHSPMLLSDIPIGNCVFLRRENGVSRIENISEGNGTDLFVNTFGANIFDMYYHPFFMNEGTIGKFALGKIKDALSNKSAEGREMAKLVGDPFLRGMLRDEFGDEDISGVDTAKADVNYEPYIEYPLE